MRTTFAIIHKKCNLPYSSLHRINYTPDKQVYFQRFKLKAKVNLLLNQLVKMHIEILLSVESSFVFLKFSYGNLTVI